MRCAGTEPTAITEHFVRNSAGFDADNPDASALMGQTCGTAGFDDQDDLILNVAP